MMVLVLAAGAGVVPAGEKHAAAERKPLQITIEAGFGGNVKQGSWFPVKATVTNPGDDVSGELAIHLTDNGSDAVYVKAVDLPANSTKVVWFTLPGASYHANNNEIVFYENGVGKGAVVPFSQNKVSLAPRTLPANALIIGVAARDPDTLNFLALLNQRGYQAEVAPLPIDEFPWKAAMLEAVDAIAFNDAATDTLTAEQVREIEAWVRQGGKLILAGGAGYSKTAEAFGELSPVRVTGMTAVERLSAFEQATGQELVLAGSFSVARAEVTDGETLFREGEIPLIVSRSYGAGEVIYAAYDLAAQPLASWSGNPALWEEILTGTANPNGINHVFTNASWELNQALESFPQFVPPNFRMLVLVFLAYAVIVGPLLYLILKKLDRREWAWAAVPALAVLASVLIYSVGATGRSSTLAQSLSVNELDGEGGAARTTAAAVFVPNGGEYTLQWEGERHLSTNRWSPGGGGPMSRADAVMRSGPERSTVTFRNVPFWSVRKIYAAAVDVPDAGRFDYELIYEAGVVSGEITNETGRTLEDAGILYGSQWVPFGNVAPGETKPFRIAPNPSQGNAGKFVYFDVSSLVFPYSGSIDAKRRERALLNSYFESQQGGLPLARAAEPLVIGFARDDGMEFSVQGASVDATRIELYAQRLRFTLERDGRFTLPGGMTVPYMETSNVTYMNQYGNGQIEVGPGDLVLAYRLPMRDGWVYEKAELSDFRFQYFTYELWNERDEAWEPIDTDSIELSGDRLAGALTAEGTIRLRLTSRTGGTLFDPALAAEGRVER